nr:MAG TPA: hypothetical protein [Caudoviricetes sp.]
MILYITTKKTNQLLYKIYFLLMDTIKIFQSRF